MILAQQKPIKKQTIRDKDPKSVLKFIQWLDQIYLEEATVTQLIVSNDYTQFLLQSGQAYTIVRDKMQQIATITRRLINHSLDIIFKNNEPTSKQLQIAIKIVSDHFQNLATANKQVCLLWQATFHNITLKQDILNQLALRQIIPNNIHVSFRILYEYMPQMFQKPNGQKIKLLHKYVSDLFRSVEKKQMTQFRQQMYKKCEKIKKQVQMLINEQANLSKAMNQKEYLEIMSFTQDNQNEFQNQSDFQTRQDQFDTNKVSCNNIMQVQKNKKNKKRKNRKKKKKEQNQQIISQKLDKNNESDDLPDIISIKCERQNFKHQNYLNQTQNYKVQLCNKVKLSTKQLQKMKREQIDQDIQYNQSQNQIQQWSDFQLTTLNYIQSFQLLENRLQCNVSQEYLTYLNLQIENLINNMKINN